MGDTFCIVLAIKKSMFCKALLSLSIIGVKRIFVHIAEHIKFTYQKQEEWQVQIPSPSLSSYPDYPDHPDHPYNHNSPHPQIASSPVDNARCLNPTATYQDCLHHRTEHQYDTIPGVSPDRQKWNAVWLGRNVNGSGS